MFKDAKYLLAYALPVCGFLGLYLGGVWSLGSFYFAFVFIPVSELLIAGSTENLSPEEEEKKSKLFYFDALLWLNLPILFGILLYFFQKIASDSFTTLELLGATLNVGVLCGSMGINVAHELGHRENKLEQWIAKSLLVGSLYIHFFIEHNRGHHKNVATDADPSSARKGEIIYVFWLRSIWGGWIDAWKLEKQRLEKIGKSPFSFANEMVGFQLIQLTYLLLVAYFFGIKAVFFAVVAAFVGIFLLESVNYIEHYGLRRSKLANGRYENVQPKHSWNSDHEIGRIVLYELTRHSDHHFKATRKYQVLRHFDESPQLPLGYPGSIWISLVPPLWFKIMDKKLAQMQE